MKTKAPFIAMILFSLIVSFSFAGCSRWYTEYGIDGSQLKSQEVLPQLILALDDPNSHTRHSSLRIISRLGLYGKDAVPKVVDLAKNDEEESIRLYAIKVLRLIMPATPENFTILEEIKKINTGDLAIEAENSLIYLKKRKSMTDPTFDDTIKIVDGITITVMPEPSFYNGYKTIDITSRGIIPIKIDINNQSSHPFHLDAKTFTLTDDTGKSSQPIPLEIVIKKQQYSIGKTFLLGFPVVSQVRAGRANGIISKFCEENVLTSVDVPPGKTSEKILFFNCTRRARVFSGWQLAFSSQQRNDPVRTNVEYIFDTGINITTEPATEIDGWASTSTPIHQSEAPPLSLEQKLLELKNLRDKNLITEKEYATKRNNLIDQF
jgi:hypothetical protein